MVLLATLQFFKFGLNNLIDIFLVAILLFELYRLLKGSSALRIVWAIAIIYVLWKVVSFFQLTLLSDIIGGIISLGAISLIIVFQPEIRKFLLFFGNTRLIKWVSGRFHKQTKGDFNDEVQAVTRACRRMAAAKTGALIIFAKETPMDDILATGEKLDAIVSRDLVENIFYKNSPLHDGGMLIKGHRIAAARCILPVSKKESLPTDLGLRHRSAIGVTTMSDAIAVVVSEQTGQISFCKNGEITRDISPTILRQMLMEELDPKGAWTVKEETA